MKSVEGCRVGSGWDYITGGAIFGGVGIDVWEWFGWMLFQSLDCFFIDPMIAGVAEIQSYKVLFSTLEISCLQPVWS